jgi:hypothetical protein
LEKWKSAWRARFRADEPSYQKLHRMCSNCRALIDRGASVCPLCGAPTGPVRARTGAGPERVLGIIPVPSTATSVLVVVNIILYGLSWYLTQTSGADLAGGEMGGVLQDSVLWTLAWVVLTVVGYVVQLQSTRRFEIEVERYRFGGTPGRT